jgi:endonuclease G
VVVTKREGNWMTVRRLRVLALLVGTLFLLSCSAIEKQVDRVVNPKPELSDPNLIQKFLPFGNPSNAATEISSPNNYLVFKRSFAFSYNNERGTVNWIAWRTTLSDLGDALPRPQFEPDTSLPPFFRRITPFDYSGSGYDRGHMVPSADRFGDPGSNQETFLMTNIVPQAADLNQYVWEKLERYARGIARRGNDVYTIAGAYGSKQRIKGKLTVPTNCWKIIVVLPAGGSTVISESTRIIAVDIPNENGIKNIYWQRFRTSVRSIEQKTGFNFFSSLPQSLQDRLELATDVQ